MQIVIDIPEEMLNRIKYLEPHGDTLLDKLLRSVQHGIPLPKGHGMLKDVDWIDNECPYYHTDDDGSLCFKLRDIEDAPTIIEADKDGEQE